MVPNLVHLLLVLASCIALSNIALSDKKIRLGQNRLSRSDKYMIDTAGKMLWWDWACIYSLSSLAEGQHNKFAEAKSVSRSCGSGTGHQMYILGKLKLIVLCFLFSENLGLSEQEIINFGVRI